MNLLNSDLEMMMRSFTKAFDESNLDEVMTHFASDAIYRTVQGEAIKGKELIRKEFEPQFNGAYGNMNFDITQVNIDNTQNRLTLVWTCHHDFNVKANGFKNNLTRILYRMLSGRKAFWYGLDVFEFDQQNRIKVKSSYTTSKFPRMFRE